MSVPRKRQYNPAIPVHIDQEKLPTGCYWDKKKRHWYASDGKHRARIAGPKATMSQLHQRMEERKEGQINTFRWMSGKYKQSQRFKSLAIKTQKNYTRSETIINTFSTKVGQPLGDVQLDRWKNSTVQKLVDKVAEKNGPKAANDVLKYARIVFKWGRNRDLCKTNPTDNIERAKERKQRRLPNERVLDILINRARIRGAFPQNKKGSCPPYLWCIFVIGVEMRHRGIETVRLTDADISNEGIRSVRAKGSKANITLWNSQLREAVKFLKDYRAEVWEKKRFPIPARPEDRHLFIARTGEPLTKEGFDSNYGKFIRRAIKEGAITEEQRFGPHDLKRRGVTDTEGTRGEKALTTGHKDESVIDVYDFSVAKVKPVSE